MRPPWNALASSSAPAWNSGRRQAAYGRPPTVTDPARVRAVDPVGLAAGAATALAWGLVGTLVRSIPALTPTELVAGRLLFALAATARGVTQLITQYAEAPLAYVLSLVAGIVYIVATVTLARGTATSRRVALVAVSVELVGVLTVGTLSVLDPDVTRQLEDDFDAELPRCERISPRRWQDRPLHQKAQEKATTVIHRFL